MEVHWSEKALKDLQNIYDFIALESKDGAKKVISNILDREEQLSLNPNSGTIESSLKLKRTYR